MSDEENPMGFVRSKLPWIVGAGALALFLLTLNQWVNLRSLPVTAKVAGWEPGLPIVGPLFYLVTLPLHFFPASMQANAANTFTALLAVLTLVLLARSVALLPHDRTHEQRLRERSDYSLLSIGSAWVPVLLAAGVCALQLTFWENATAMTGEMLDLLVFAYLIRCLLEYRISMDDLWLSKLAFVYGLGITNNSALIAFFPLFLGAVIWIRGIRFFEPAFLVRMASLGCLGLLLYLFLPILWVARHEGDYTFFQVLRSNLGAQKAFLVDIPSLRNRVLLLSLTSVLPIILMGVRWPSKSGETSAAGANLTTLAFRVIHLFIPAACIFVAFDPKFSPRELGLGVPFLTFYYLGALAVGYYSGYALLVFRDPPRKSWRRENVLWKILNPVVRGVVLIAMVAVPVALAARNLPRVRANNGSVLKEYVGQLAQSLPPSPAYLLSEDPYQLALVQAFLSTEGKREGYVLVNARGLEAPEYHDQLHKRYGERWPWVTAREDFGTRIGPLDVQHLVLGIASSNSVAYLHPSFGYFFETIYPQPNGLAYRLTPFAADQVLPPALTDEQISQNDAFWAGKQDFAAKLSDLKKLESLDGRYVGLAYSRALNNWGVLLQRSGRFPAASKLFATALDLNTNNVPAKFNLEANRVYQKGEGANYDSGKTLEQKLGNYRSWDTMLQENGPFDHPEFCALLGDGFLNQAQYRQAASQFSRVAFFQPTNLAARISLAKAYVYGNWAEKGMAEIQAIEKDFSGRPVSDQADIIALKAAAFFANKEFPKAEQLLQSARSRYPDEGSLTQALFELYRVSGRTTNALAVANQQLESNPTNMVVLLQKAELQLNMDDLAGAHATAAEVLKLAPKSSSALLFEAFVFIRESNYPQAQASLEKVLQQDPDNVQAMLYKGITLMEQKQTDKARDAFDKVLDKQSDNVAALRNRAILNLRAQQWAAAETDYQRLRKLTPRSHAVMYGLAEVAYAQKNFIDATRYYELYLKYAPQEATGDLLEEKRKVQDRLKELKSVVK